MIAVNNSVLNRMRDSTLSRTLAHLLLAVFVWTQFLPTAALAAESARKTKPAALSFQPSNAVADAMQQMLQRAAQAQEQKAKSQAQIQKGGKAKPSLKARKEALKLLRAQLVEDSKASKKEFETAAQHIATAKLPDSIRQRQQQADAAYQARIGAVFKAMDGADAAKTEAEFTQKAEKLVKALEAGQGAQSARTLKRDAIPFQIPGTKVRAPKTGKRVLSEIAAPPLMVADDGDSWALLAMSALGMPVPADIAASEDVQISSAIHDLAAQLHNNPVEIYAWVYSNVSYMPTYGSIQGSTHTLESRQGNAYDIASLLIALLRAANIPARYVYGTVEVPAASLQNLLGGLRDQVSALNLLAQGGIPSRSVTIGGQIQAVQMEHVWVEAYVDFYPSRGVKNIEPDSWASLDASLKLLDIKPGAYLANSVSTDAYGLMGQLERTATLNAVQGRLSGLDPTAVQSALTGYQSQVNNYIASLGADATVAQVLGTRGIQASEITALPASLPFKVLDSAAPSASLADNLRHQFRFSLYGSSAARANQQSAVSFMRSLPALGGKRLTLSFTPLTADDQAALDSYFPQAHADGSPILPAEFPSEIPGYLIHLKAEVRVDGELLASGGDFALGTPLYLSSGLLDPVTSAWSEAEDVVYAGEYQAFAVDGAGISPADLSANADRAASVAANLSSQAYELLTRDQVTGEVLHSTATGYFAIADAYARHYQRAAAVSAFRLPSSARAAAAEVLPTFEFGVPKSVRFPGVALRVDRLSASAAGINEEVLAANKQAVSYQRQTLERGSAYAHLVLENLFSAASQGAPGASAIKALATAISDGSALYTLDRSNVLAALPSITAPDDTKSDLVNAVNAGLLGIVSESPVLIGAWQGSGYILADSETGAGAYLLDGGATAVLHSAAGMPWLALATPAQSAASLAPVFAAAQQLDTAQQALLGDTDGLRWSEFGAAAEISAGLFSGLLSAISSPAALGWAVDVQATSYGSSAAGALSQVNRAPLFTTSAITTATAGKPYRYSSSAADPDGDPIIYSIAQAPGGVSISGTGLVAWDQTVEGQWPVSLRISDGKSQTLQSFTLKVKAAPAPLTLSLSVTPAVVNPGQTVSLSVSTTGGAGTVNRVLSVAGQDLPLTSMGQATFTAPSASGVYRVVATATDEDAVSKTQSGLFSVRDPNDTTPPLASIDSPAADTEITAPITVMGSATDNAALAYYRLLLRPAGGSDSQWAEIARGEQPVVNGPLGQLNPTTLANGLYDLGLYVTDANGLTASQVVPLEINRDLKLGQFSITFEDLSIEASGIPIRVTRTYDTRTKDQKLDFGYGWSVDAQAIQVRKNMTLGLNWQIYQQQFALCVRVLGKRKINITLPGGKVERFEAQNTDACATGTVPPVNVAFKPLPGTTSRLEVYNVPNLEFRGGQIYDMDNFGPYDPLDFKLITEDGITYYLKQGVGILRAQDAYGNTLDYTPGGLIHSDGRSIPFVRDSQGRITVITDPSGKQIKYSYNSQGDLVSVTDREGQTTTLAYNATHHLTDYTDPRGIKLAKQIYDEEGRLIATIDANGQRTEVSHDTQNNLELVKDKNGYVTSYLYDSAGNVTEKTDPLGQTTTYTYDALGNELTVTDPLGNITTRSFDALSGKQLSEQDPLGNTTLFTLAPATEFDQSRNLLSTTDPRSNITRYQNYAGGTPTLIEEPLGRTTFLGINASGNLSNLSLAGESTVFTYDSKGNRLTEKDALNQLTSYSFDSNGRETGKTWTLTGADGSSKSYSDSRVYDKEGRVTKHTDALGYSTSTLYNAAGKPIEETDALGKKTVHLYDEQLRKVQTSYPDGSSEKTQYDSEGNEVNKTDRQGRVTQTRYDALNRAVQIIRPDGSSTATTYDAAGRIASQTDGRGNATTNSYDAAGRLTSVTDALGNITRYGYDENGNRTSSTLPPATPGAVAQVTTYEYDALNRLTQTTNPDGNTRSIAWTLQGRKQSETDENGVTTRYGYDAKGQLSSVTQALSTGSGNTDLITSYSYDHAGNKLSQTDAQGRITKWSYDGSNRQTSRTLPGNQKESFQYDAAGNLTQHTDFKGQITQYRYDSNGWQTLKLLPATAGQANARITTTYAPSGQIETLTSSLGTTRYFYDANERLSQKQSPEGTLSYQYDRNGNKTRISTSSGSTNYQYDELNRLISVTDSSSKQTTYQYDAIGNRTRVSLPNNTTTQYEYDQNNRLTKLTHQRTDTASVLAQYRYTLRPNGQRSQLSEFNSSSAASSNQPDRVISYQYDSLYRLIEEKVESRNTSAGNLEVSRTTNFSYDATGNRLSQTNVIPAQAGIQVSTETTSYSYDSNDRLLTETKSITPSPPAGEGGGEGAASYAYDANGNTTQKIFTPTAGSASVTLYSYDSDNRLTQIKQGATEQSASLIASYQYDPQGNRTSATTAHNTTTTFLVDTNQQYAQVIEETKTGAQTGKVIYVYGDDLLSQTRGGQQIFYHYDGLGSTRLLTDSSGAATDRYSYTAFGETEQHEGSTPNDFLFAGEQLDPNLGWYYLRARYMDPSVGRFTAIDRWQGALGNPQSLHKYNYVHSDPVNGTDPSGLITMTEVSVGIATLGVLTIAATINIRPGILQGDSPKFNLWDALVATRMLGVAAAATVIAQVTTNIRRDPGHHTIPIYLCGAVAQVTCEISFAQHVAIHRGLSAIQVLILGAEYEADRLIPLGRRRNPALIRFATTSDGRGAIARVIGDFYQVDGWSGVGTPTIGSVFPNEAREYIQGRTSLPSCSRR